MYSYLGLCAHRVMWTLVFLAGIAFSSFFIAQMWNKWEKSPVLLSVDSNRYPLKNIPFPAVTICNVNKVSKTKLLQVLKEPKSVHPIQICALLTID